MERTVIYGAGVKGVFIKQILVKLNNLVKEKHDIVCFCDTYKRTGSYVDGIEVISPKQLKQREKEFDKIIISSLFFADEIQKELRNVRITLPVYIIPDYVFSFKWNEKETPFFIKIDIEKPRMPYLEIKIVEHCNLNCKGCSALANVNERKFMDIQEFTEAIKKLKEIFWGIKDLKLLGGEPLLHPELKKFISVAREYFPDSNLVVHSNGLLIPDMDASLFRMMNELNVSFEFTQYPPTGLKKRMIEKILQKYGVKYKFREALYEFQKTINVAGDYDAKEVYESCCKCINLINGTLSCGIGWMINGLEEKYHTKICDDKFQHCIDIFNTELNGWEINRILDSPFNLCSYCAFMNVGDVDERMMKWESGGPYNLSDWVYEKNENQN